MKSTKRILLEQNETSRKNAMQKADGSDGVKSEPLLWELSLNDAYKKPPTQKEKLQNPALEFESGIGANYPLRLSEYHDQWIKLFEKKERRTRQQMIIQVLDFYIQAKLPGLMKEQDSDDEIISS